jgi:hypothetical protein
VRAQSRTGHVAVGRAKRRQAAVDRADDRDSLRIAVEQLARDE